MKFISIEAPRILGLFLLAAVLGAADPVPRVASKPVETSVGTSTSRQRLSLNNDWAFALGNVADLEAGRCSGSYLLKAGDGFTCKKMRSMGQLKPTQIQLPHDWAVGLPADSKAFPENAFTPLGPLFPETSIGWYWRSFTLDPADGKRRLTLQFDGVFRNAMVWVNGFYLGVHESGYEGFRYDITDVVEIGKGNDIVVRVDASQREGWWYEGAGIYRNVWLIKADPLAIAHDGIFVRTDFPDENPQATPTVRVEARVRNGQREQREVTVIQEVVDAKGAQVASARGTATLAAGEERTVSTSAPVPNPALWSLSSPTMYSLVTRVVCADQTTDEVRTPFAFRTIRWDGAQGFLLNGKQVKLKGVCWHNDYPAVGTAMTAGLHEYRIGVIKSYGANALRMSHNPPDPELLDLCDRMGVLVMDEVRAFGSTEYALHQLTSMVTRDRNHPSVILWSIGNEEIVQNYPSGRRMGRTVVDLVHRLDPTRPTTLGNNHSDKEDGVNASLDVHGWNYGSLDTQWTPYHEKYPMLPTVATEINALNPAFGDPTTKDTQRMRYNRASFWRKVATTPWVAGVFYWTGFDYAGEVGRDAFPKRHSSFGIVDRIGMRKDVTWCYQGLWDDTPLVKVLNVGSKVTVAANTEEVELLCNGTSLGRLKQDPANLQEVLTWAAPGGKGPGMYEARGYRGNEVVATDILTPIGPAVKVSLVVPRTNLVADPQERILVNACVVDEAGRTVASDTRTIRFIVQGPATLIGVGNGDSAGLQPELASSIPAYKGRAQAIIAALATPGTVKIVAQAEGLPEQAIEVATVLSAHPVLLVPSGAANPDPAKPK